MNVGGFDRILRLGGGLGLLIIDFIASGDLELALLLVSAWSVLTSAFGWCPFLSSWRNHHLCNKPTVARRMTESLI